MRKLWYTALVFCLLVLVSPVQAEVLPGLLDLSPFVADFHGPPSDGTTGHKAFLLSNTPLTFTAGAITPSVNQRGYTRSIQRGKGKAAIRLPFG